MTEMRNEEAGYVEFVNDDVPFIVREIEGRVAILLELEQPRRVIGYRVYDPGYSPSEVFGDPTALAPQVKVRELAWELVDDDHYAARGLGLGYEVRKSQILDSVRVRFAGGMFSEWQDFDGDIEAAKSAAQADYTARIMSALEGNGHE